MMTDLVEQEFQQPTAEMRKKILQLEAAMLAMPQVDIPLKHYFAPGLYLREMTMPANSTLTGMIHKTEHLCVLAKGRVSVATEHGTVEHSAPAVIHAMPGAKRAIHAHEETVWINVHHNPTNEQELDKIWDIFVVDSYDKFLTFMEQKQIEGGK